MRTSLVVFSAGEITTPVGIISVEENGSELDGRLVISIGNNEAVEINDWKGECVFVVNGENSVEIGRVVECDVSIFVANCDNFGENDDVEIVDDNKLE